MSIARSDCAHREPLSRPGNAAPCRTRERLRDSRCADLGHFNYAHTVRRMLRRVDEGAEHFVKRNETQSPSRGPRRRDRLK
jgi:hypothetical protein